MDYQKYHPIPQPDEINFRHKEKAMGAYMMMLASNIIGLPFPIFTLLLSYLYYRSVDRHQRFVRFHALQSLISQLPISIMNTVAIVGLVRSLFLNIELSGLFWGFILTVGIFNLLYLIFSFIAAFQARKGRFFYILFFGGWSYHHVYLRRAGDELDTYSHSINQPPHL